ncbi:MAG: ORF6N domain-containing protein [Elusimicrobia bacterium]|nr:ORF6N domain-containing protein [Elusimicrobiota bacterium]
MELPNLQNVERRIYSIRGHRVILDADLAVLYCVETWELVRAVKRNRERFPEDFMFQLSSDESDNLTRQIGGSSSSGWGGRRRPPYVFTEQGVAMLSGVLRSSRAVEVNVAIMRAFVKLREMVSAHKELARRLDELERKYNKRFRLVFEAIRELMEPSEQPKRRIGFHARKE